MNETDDILFERRGAVGLITLNRPKALNALTHAMCLAMHTKLMEWANSDAIGCVVIRGAGDRAFCAGGDIRALYDSGKTDTPYIFDFYRDEYLLNAYIKHYPKPYIALIGGIVMGGGVGVSVHGRYRVADATTVFAMPETGIGLFPDVGGSYFLPRLPGEIGMFLGLTGTRLRRDDLIACGIATDASGATSENEIIAALAKGENPGNLMSEVTGLYILEREKDLEPASLNALRTNIDRCFAGNSIEAILSALDADQSAWARESATAIRSKSPTATKLAFRQIRNGATLDFDDCMRMEFRMVNRVIAGHDFYEGVRATIIDKDGAPKWRPASLAEVSEQDIDAYFATLGAKELPL